MRLTIPVVPIAQPRQRHAVIGGRIRNYTPADHPVQAYKAALMLAARDLRLAEPIQGPIRLDIDFYLPRPKRLMRKKDPDGPIPHTSKPDVDNLWKSTVDALSGLVWRDDTLICQTKARKWYHEKGGAPRVELWVEEISEKFWADPPGLYIAVEELTP